MTRSITSVLLCAALAACSPYPDLPATMDEAKPMIIKRWVQSPKHCQGLLDDRILDFTFIEEGVQSGGATVKGSYTFYDDKDVERVFSDYLKANHNCTKPIPEDEAPFQMIKFSTYEQRFILAVFPGQDFMLRLVGGEVFPVIPFPEGSDYLRTLNYEN